MRKPRRIAATALILTSLAVALASSPVSAAHGHGRRATPTLASCRKSVPKNSLAKGVLTLATDNPVLAPWFIDNTPSNAEGYEGALAYYLANELGYPAKDVTWVTEPFADSYQPGSKNFDFDIDEVPNDPAWSSNVSFSTGYYQVTQSLVAMKSDPIVKHHTRKELPTYHYGAIANSPAFDYVATKIAPTTPVTAYDTLTDAVNALEQGTIDALVVDTPTAYISVHWDIVDASGNRLAALVGQFAANGDEDYSLVLQKGSPLLACVDVAVATASKRGELAALAKKWLAVYRAVPTIKP